MGGIWIFRQIYFTSFLKVCEMSFIGFYCFVLPSFNRLFICWFCRIFVPYLLKINLVVFLPGGKNSLPSFFYFSLMMPAKICRICRNISCWASFCFYSLDLFSKSNLSNYDCLLLFFSKLQCFFYSCLLELEDF